MLLGMNRYQWTVLFAAWLGWGFDIFDGLLFNYVAPNAVPTLLGLEIGSAEDGVDLLLQQRADRGEQPRPRRGVEGRQVALGV